MAFDNVTFFELHLDSPTFGGESAAAPEEELLEAAPRRSATVPLGLLVLLGVGAAVAARRLRRDDDLAVDLEDAEPIAVE